MKKLLFLWLLFPFISFAQTTTVSVTVMDSTGQVWSNGTISYQFKRNPIFNNTPLYNGAPISNSLLTPTLVSLDNTGSATIVVPTSTSIFPAGSSWTYTVCPNASTQVCNSVDIPAIGNTQNISSTVTAAISPISISVTPIPIAYNDNQIKLTPAQSGFYFNSVSKTPKYWNGSAWQDLGGAGSVIGQSFLPATYALGTGNNGPISYTNSSYQCSSDACFTAALSNSITQASVQLPTSVVTTQTGITIPTPTGTNSPLALTVFGQGTSDFTQTNVLSAGVGVTNPVIYAPYFSTTSNYYNNNTFVHDITILANNQSVSCIGAYAIRQSVFSNVTCDSSKNPFAWMIFGGLSSAFGGTVPSGFASGGVQGVYDNIWPFFNSCAAGSCNSQSAVVTVTPTGGVLSAGSFTTVSAGNFRVSGTAPVFLKGTDASVLPCTSTGAQITANLTASSNVGFNQISSYNVPTGWSGCSNVTATVVDMPIASYGASFNTTDSDSRASKVTGVGQLAAYYLRSDSASAYYHPHPVNVPTGFYTYSGEYADYAECDSMYISCVDFKFSAGAGTIFSHTNLIYPTTPTGTHLYDSVADFRNYGSTNITISDTQCQNLNTNPGYIHFLDSNNNTTLLSKDVGYGVLNPSLPAANIPATMAWTTGTWLFHDTPCFAAPTYSSNFFVESTPNWSTDPNRKMTYAAGNNSSSTTQNPVLIAELYPSTGGQFNRSGMRISLTGGAENSAPWTDIIQLMNTTGGLIYQHFGYGNQSGNANAYVRAYTQANGSVNVYAYTGSFGIEAISIDQVTDPQTHYEEKWVQQAPTGTIAFDSSNVTTYPYSDFYVGNIHAATTTITNVSGTTGSFTGNVSSSAGDAAFNNFRGNGTGGMFVTPNSSQNEFFGFGNTWGVSPSGTLFLVGGKWSVDVNGTIHQSGTSPTASAGTITGANAGGFVSSLSAATTLSLTFANGGWSTWASCTATASSGNVVTSSITGASVTFTFPALTGTLYYQCNGN